MCERKCVHALCTASGRIDGRIDGIDKEKVVGRGVAAQHRKLSGLLLFFYYHFFLILFILFEQAERERIHWEFGFKKSFRGERGESLLIGDWTVDTGDWVVG
jgi:hypothetical protein